jgi:hypothetical protein
MNIIEIEAMIRIKWKVMILNKNGMGRVCRPGGPDDATFNGGLMRE